LVLAIQREGNRLLAAELKPLGITPSQAEVLRVLRDYGPLTLNALGGLLVCETGFKFDDFLYRSHFMPLSGQLVVDDFLSDRFVKRSAECFASELVKQLETTKQDRP